mgnify:CR=1 FL=1
MILASQTRDCRQFKLAQQHTGHISYVCVCFATKHEAVMIYVGSAHVLKKRCISMLYTARFSNRKHRHNIAALYRYILFFRTDSELHCA